MTSVISSDGGTQQHLSTLLASLH